jgi:hypothetical protein
MTCRRLRRSLPSWSRRRRIRPGRSKAQPAPWSAPLPA